MSTQLLETAPSTLTRWSIDPAHALIELAVRHMMITTVKGRFRELTGTILFDEAQPERSSVEVAIAAASIDTGVGQRDEHLRSADFLDAANHPWLEFRSRRIEGGPRQPGDSFRVVGDLTIRGVTREVALDAVFEGRAAGADGERASFSATTRIDRRDFGLTWNQALETGGVLVANEVRISLEVPAARV